MKCYLLPKESLWTGGRLFVWEQWRSSSSCSSVKEGNQQPIIYSAMLSGLDWLLQLVSSRAWKLKPFPLGVYWLSTVQLDTKQAVTYTDSIAVQQVCRVPRCVLALFSSFQQMFIICAIITSHTVRAFTLSQYVCLHLCLCVCFRVRTWMYVIFTWEQWFSVSSFLKIKNHVSYLFVISILKICNTNIGSCLYYENIICIWYFKNNLLLDFCFYNYTIISVRNQLHICVFSSFFSSLSTNRSIFQAC